jgi:hypothetical protein
LITGLTSLPKNPEVLFFCSSTTLYHTDLSLKPILTHETYEIKEDSDIISIENFNETSFFITCSNGMVLKAEISKGGEVEVKEIARTLEDENVKNDEDHVIVNCAKLLKNHSYVAIGTDDMRLIFYDIFDERNKQRTIHLKSIVL